MITQYLLKGFVALLLLCLSGMSYACGDSPRQESAKDREIRELQDKIYEEQRKADEERRARQKLLETVKAHPVTEIGFLLREVQFLSGAIRNPHTEVLQRVSTGQQPTLPQAEALTKSYAQIAENQNRIISLMRSMGFSEALSELVALDREVAKQWLERELESEQQRAYEMQQGVDLTALEQVRKKIGYMQILYKELSGGVTAPERRVFTPTSETPCCTEIRASQ